MIEVRKLGFLRTIPLLITICMVSFPVYAKYNGGTGEPNDPYLIYKAEDMNAIGAEPNDWDKHFKLMADIDLSSYTGTVFNIIGSWDNTFTGFFDGNGHTISNFSYNSTNASYIGLFGYVGTWGEKAVVKDLGLIDPNINAGTGEYIGSLVGVLKNGTVNNCYVEGGSVVGGYSVGGLVGAYGEGMRGYLDPPFTISNCYSTSSVQGTWYVGGLVGSNYEGRIVNSYATGNVSGERCVGGLVGQNGSILDFPPPPGTILNCYSTGLVSGEYNVGGLLGRNNVGSVISCLWDIETSGQLRSACGAGKTTTEMKTASTFLEAGWDFMNESVNGTENIWWIDEEQGYPRLWWEPSSEDMLFLVVDDFEGYNDLHIEEPESNLIWNTWIDGFDNTEINGSLIGESMPPFVGWSIAHTGKESMPYYYDNSGPANYSEATANVVNLKAGHDWTKHGFKTLSLWFRRFMEHDPWFGGRENDPEPTYVSLANTNGPTAVVYHDDPNVTQIAEWTEWRIDLQVFADQGVDLTNINTISIGFGYKNNPQPGGSGKMHFDDIRLYRPDSQEQTP